MGPGFSESMVKGMTYIRLPVDLPFSRVVVTISEGPTLRDERRAIVTKYLGEYGGIDTVLDEFERLDAEYAK